MRRWWEPDGAGPGFAASPDTSKWNTIDHRALATTTRTGLTIRAGYHLNLYPKGARITDTEFTAARSIDRHDWHGNWNYTLRPPKRRRLS